LDLLGVRYVLAEVPADTPAARLSGQLGPIRIYQRSTALPRAFVVPLRFGGGTRLKILEAMAYGVPVVTTSVGCEGLELEHERDVLVADHPRDFAGWIDRLLEDDELCARLGANGRRTVERHYDWKAIGDRLDAALGKALERR
jgi:glycosyltransferase involved in cell wall biosynthesis